MKRHTGICHLTLLAMTTAILGSASPQMPTVQAAYAQEITYPETKTEKPKKKAVASKEDDKDEEEDEEEKQTSLEEMVKDHEKIEGLFTFYRDKEDGSLLLEISKEQLEEGVEFIYHGVMLNGAAEVGFFHILGSYFYPKIIRFSKHYDRIEIIQENASFYFDPDNALSRASDANIPPALLAVASIAAKSEDETRYLIDGDALFKSEALSQITPSNFPGHSTPGGFEPGSINDEKSRIVYTRSHPRNSTVAVDFVFDNETPSNYGKDDITNGRTVTVTFQHSLIAMPEPGFEPRLDDQRVGYFRSRVTDLTDPGSTPYRDMINRWRLVKKDPEAALSEPVKPITYWIENTTPVEYREALVKGVLAWNSAFEKAGFKNAVEAKIMPDDAEWDPGDIDYNVIRWVSSPQPMYGGIGPSLPNPRTGEIIATDIVLEQVFVNYRIVYTEMFEEAGASEQLCSAGRHIQQNTMMGITTLRAQGASEAEIGVVVQEGLIELALHEVGHTLGLMHNMKGSQAVAYEDVHSEETKTKGYVTGSVMDYATINLHADKKKQGLYYSVAPGPYDDWAIEFGYTPSLEDGDAEASRVEALLSRSTEKALAFGNDADDMRGPNGGIDPRTMVDDLTDNAVQYGIDRVELVNNRLQGLKPAFEKQGETWDDMVVAYTILTNQKYSQARVISNYIGGVYLERSVIGQDGAKTPYTPVDGKDQRRAMEALNTYVFAPDAWQVPAELLQHLQSKRRGQEQRGKEGPRPHARTLTFQSSILGALLNPVTMQRILDSSLYGNDYQPAEVLQDLTDGIFVADLRGSVNSQRQNLQLHYVERLIGMTSSEMGQSYAVQSAALYQLRRIEKMERQARSRDIATAGHRNHVRLWIEQTLYGQGSRM